MGARGYWGDDGGGEGRGVCGVEDWGDEGSGAWLVVLLKVVLVRGWILTAILVVPFRPENRRSGQLLATAVIVLRSAVFFARNLGCA